VEDRSRYEEQGPKDLGHRQLAAVKISDVTRQNADDVEPSCLLAMAEIVGEVRRCYIYPMPTLVYRQGEPA